MIKKLRSTQHTPRVTGSHHS